MVNKPVVVKDYHQPIECTRKDLYEEEIDKVTGRKGMIFKGYKTEKERIVIKINNIRKIIYVQQILFLLL